MLDILEREKSVRDYEKFSHAVAKSHTHTPESQEDFLGSLQSDKRFFTLFEDATHYLLCFVFLARLFAGVA